MSVDENSLCRCGHPRRHHDANECWTTPTGQETYDEPACRCSGFELANCDASSEETRLHVGHQIQQAEAQAVCDHDWEPFWDGSLGYSATDSCTRCRAYRPSGAS